MTGSRISAVAYQLGEVLEDNQALLSENPSWDVTAIENATGIVSRRLSRPDQTASDLAIAAADKLFLTTGMNRAQINALILCTQSPDYLIPTTACILQDKLKLSTALMAFDINMACSGYIYGLALARSLIASGQASTVLLLNADTYSKFIVKTNRTCRPLFGDGASATLVEAIEGEERIGPFDFGTDGRGHEKLILRGSGTRLPAQHPAQLNLEMDGAGILMFTMSVVPRTVDALLKKTGLAKNDIDLFVFHQASKKVLDNLERVLAIPEDKMYRSFAQHGNTVSASIPVALAEAVSEGRLKPGYRLMLIGFGVGLSWGGCLVTWSEAIRHSQPDSGDNHASVRR